MRGRSCRTAHRFGLSAAVPLRRHRKDASGARRRPQATVAPPRTGAAPPSHHHRPLAAAIPTWCEGCPLPMCSAARTCRAGAVVVQRQVASGRMPMHAMPCLCASGTRRCPLEPTDLASMALAPERSSSAGDPDEAATKLFAGCRKDSSVRPTCSIRPAFITTILSARSSPRPDRWVDMPLVGQAGPLGRAKLHPHVDAHSARQVRQGSSTQEDLRFAHDCTADATAGAGRQTTARLCVPGGPRSFRISAASLGRGCRSRPWRCPPRRNAYPMFCATVMCG